MDHNRDNMYRIDTDKAWNNLYARLENDRLLITCKPEYSPRRKRLIYFKRVAAVAAICAGVVFLIFHFSKKNDNQPIVVHNIEKTGTLVTTLKDGSIICLAGNASISHPSTFAENNRKVELTGNALFYVSKDEKRPFIVMINDITVEVVGTVFSIQSSFENLFELFVKEGKVKVYSKGDQTGFMVEAGETIHLNESGLSKCQIINMNELNSFTDKMSFKDEKLNNIIQVINTTHGSPALIIDESLSNRSLTVTFENNSVEKMIELICIALDLEYINKQDTIVICPFTK